MRSKTDEPFYKISYDVWIWNTEGPNVAREDTPKHSTAKTDTERSYWLYARGENATYWEEFYSKEIMGLGWNRLGDLNHIPLRKKWNEILRRNAKKCISSML